MQNERPIKDFVAAKGVVIYQGRVLFLRESGSYLDGSNIGKFDIPGGRLNPGEEWIPGLRREILEETGLVIADARPFYVRDWRVTRPTEDWHIHAVFFAVPVDSDQVRLSDDHDDYVWIAPAFADQKIPLMKGYQDILMCLITEFTGQYGL